MTRSRLDIGKQPFIILYIASNVPNLTLHNSLTSTHSIWPWICLHARKLCSNAWKDCKSICSWQPPWPKASKWGESNNLNCICGLRGVNNSSHKLHLHNSSFILAASRFLTEVSPFISLNIATSILHVTRRLTSCPATSLPWSSNRWVSGTDKAWHLGLGRGHQESLQVWSSLGYSC